MYHLAPPDRYSKRARTTLAIIFGFLIALDIVVIVTTVPEYRSRLAPQVGLSTMWNCVLLGAVWYRQNWARYALCAFLLMSVVLGAAVTIPQMLHLKVPIPPALLVLLAFHLVAMVVVAKNPTIRKFVYSR